MRALLGSAAARSEPARRLARRLGVSEQTVTCSRRVLDRSPPMARAVAAGRLSIYAAGVRLRLWSK